MKHRERIYPGEYARVSERTHLDIVENAFDVIKKTFERPGVQHQLRNWYCKVNFHETF